MSELICGIIRNSITEIDISSGLIGRSQLIDAIVRQRFSAYSVSDLNIKQKRPTHEVNFSMGRVGATRKSPMTHPGKRWIKDSIGQDLQNSDRIRKKYNDRGQLAYNRTCKWLSAEPSHYNNVQPIVRIKTPGMGNWADWHQTFSWSVYWKGFKFNLFTSAHFSHDFKCLSTVRNISFQLEKTLAAV